ncbi:MAG TPA: ATP-binding protein [Flavisolibacter sp.]|nr:ATP-binding protein [Flavisolibacter sp.]
MSRLSPALRLALLYFVVSGVWILASDALLLKLIGNNVKLLQEIQSIKGILFVVFCSCLLYLVSRKYYMNISSALAKTEESLNRYKALAEATKEGIVDHDLISDTATVNEQMQFYMQEFSDHIEHFSFKNKKRIHPEDYPRVQRQFKEVLASDTSLWQNNHRYLLYDGTYHDISNRGFILRDSDGKPLRVITSIQDVTEIRNMRTQMLHQELKHRQSLSESMIETQEAERNRWAEELHDNVCQLLTVVKLYLEQLSTDGVQSPLLHKSKELTEKALNDIRTLSASIKPPEFSITSLNNSIEQLVSNIKRVNQFEAELDFEELHETRLKDEQKLMIYRVVQEQLNNIIKYAAASYIKIILTVNENTAHISIEDNGNGFDPSSLITGIGLRNIRSRLEVYSGELKLDSAPGKGCRLEANFSLT